MKRIKEILVNNKLGHFLLRHSAITVATAVSGCLIACSLLAFMAKVNLDTRHNMKQQVIAISDVSIRLLQKEADSLWRLTETAAGFMSENQYETDEEIIRALREYIQSGDIVRAFFMCEDGLVISSYSEVHRHDVAEIGGIAVADATETFYPQPFYSEVAGKVVFGVATPLIMGEKKGVLFSSYDVEQFQTLFENEFLDGEACVEIVNSRGRVIVGKSSIFDFEGIGADYFELLEQASAQFSDGSIEEMSCDLENGAEGFVSYSVNGTKRYCAYAPAGINDWSVAVTVSETALKAQTSSIVKSGIFLTAELVCIMVVLLTAITVVRHKEQDQVRTFLKCAAMMDGLTKIYNRGAVESIITSFLDSEGAGKKHALFLMDIDSFKDINDNFGHLVGDSVLRQFANQLQHVFSEKDILGRMGGDEFIALMRDYGDVESVKEKAEAIGRGFSEKVKEEKEGMVSSISIGIALFDTDGECFTQLYQKADDALYFTKEKGKNGFTFFRDI